MAGCASCDDIAPRIIANKTTSTQAVRAFQGGFAEAWGGLGAFSEVRGRVMGGRTKRAGGTEVGGGAGSGVRGEGGEGVGATTLGRRGVAAMKRVGSSSSSGGASSEA